MRVLSAPCPACRHFLALLDNGQATQHVTCDQCHVVLEVVRLTETVSELRRYRETPGSMEMNDYE